MRNARKTKLGITPKSNSTVVASRAFLTFDGCIESSQAPNREGYPRLWINKRYVNMSRFILHITGRMSLDSPLFALHHCDNTRCINPDHLYPGTPSDNARDTRVRGRTLVGKYYSPYKYSDSFVKKLRKEYALGHRQFELCRKYKLAKGTLRNLLFRPITKKFGVCQK